MRHMNQVGRPCKFTFYRRPQLQIVVPVLCDERVGRYDDGKQFTSKKRARSEVPNEDLKLVA